MADAAEYGTLSAAGCLINADLGGKAIDPTLLTLAPALTLALTLTRTLP